MKFETPLHKASSNGERPHHFLGHRMFRSLHISLSSLLDAICVNWRESLFPNFNLIF
jgi:hypothetical protein